MEIKGGNYVSQIKRLSDRILEQILAEKNIDALTVRKGVSYTFCGAGMAFLCANWQIKQVLRQQRLQAWLTVWKRQGLYAVCQIKTTAAKHCWHLPPRLKIWSRIIKRYPIKCPKFFYKGFSDEEIRTCEAMLARILDNMKKLG